MFTYYKELSFLLGFLVIQVFFVTLRFYSPLPRTIRLQKQNSNTTDDEWLDWQHYADDCEEQFGLENNGPLETSSSVNCIQLST